MNAFRLTTNLRHKFLLFQLIFEAFGKRNEHHSPVTHVRIWNTHGPPDLKDFADANNIGVGLATIVLSMSQDLMNV